MPTKEIWTRPFKSMLRDYKSKRKVYEGQTLVTLGNRKFKVSQSNAFWIYSKAGDSRTFCWDTDSGDLFWPNRKKIGCMMDIDWVKTKAVEVEIKKQQGRAEKVQELRKAIGL